MRILWSPAALFLLAACASDVPPPAPERAPLPPALAAVDAAAAQVDPVRIRAHIDRLVSFGTRHSLSATEGERGIGAARNWLRDELGRIGEACGRTGDDALQVRFDVHAQGPA